MTLPDALTAARQAGVALWADGDRLRFSAPRGAMPDDLRRQLTANRAELLGLVPRIEPGPDPALDAALAEAIDLVARITSIRPIDFVGYVEQRARQAHAAGDAEVCRD